jgi:hypothetical protein
VTAAPRPSARGRADLVEDGQDVAAELRRVLGHREVADLGDDREAGARDLLGGEPRVLRRARDLVNAAAGALVLAARDAVGFVGPRMFAARRAAEAAAPSDAKTAAEAAQQREIEER